MNDAQRKRLRRFMIEKFPELIQESFVGPDHKPLKVDSGSQVALAARILDYYEVPFQVATCMEVVVNRQWLDFAQALGKPLSQWTRDDAVACAKRRGMSVTLGTKESPHYFIQIVDKKMLEIYDPAVSLAERPAFRMKAPAYWEPSNNLPRYVWAIEEMTHPGETIDAPRLRSFSQDARQTIVSSFIQAATIQVGHRIE